MATASGLSGSGRAVLLPPTRSERKDEKVDREERAKAICAECSVRADCLDYALRIREPHGIWGGLTEVERRELLQRPRA